MADYGMTAVSDQTVSVTTSAGGLTITSGTTPRHALITNHNDATSSQPVRWTATGTAPTSTTGQVLYPGGVIDLTDPHGDYWSVIKSIQFIRDTNAGANATLEVTLFT